MDVRMLGSAEVLRGSVGDVAERTRGASPAPRARDPHPARSSSRPSSTGACSPATRSISGWPHLSIPEEMRQYIPSMVLVVLLGTMLMLPLVMAGRVTAHALPAERDPDHVRRRRRARHRQGRGHPDAEPVPRVQDVPRSHGWHAAAGDPVRGTTRYRQDVHGQGDGARGRRAVPVRLGQRVPVDVLRPDEPQDPVVLPVAAQDRAPGGRRHRLHRGDRRDRRDAQRREQRRPPTVPTRVAACPVPTGARESAVWSTSCSCRCSRSTSRRSAAGSAAGGSTG